MLVWIILGLVALVFVVWVLRTPSSGRAGAAMAGTRARVESASHGVPTSTSLAGDLGQPFRRRDQRP